MKYLLLQLLVLIASVMFLYYFSTLEGFLPYLEGGEPNWYSISIFIVLVAFILEGVTGAISYMIQKFSAYGIREFPSSAISLRIGLSFAISWSIAITLHLFHILHFGWGFAVVLVSVWYLIFRFF